MKNTYKEVLKEILAESYIAAVEGIEPKHGIWTLEGLLGIETNVGRVQLLSGKEALVTIKIEADPEEIETYCDNLEDLPQLPRPEKLANEVKN